MSGSVRFHRQQPTRLPCPWDSPGKNTGVGCHFLLQCMKEKSESEVVQSCLTQRPHGLQPTRLLYPWDFPGKSTGMGCHCLLQKVLLILLIKLDFFFYFFFFLPHHVPYGILVTWPGLKPVASAVEVQCLNHWVIREVPKPWNLKKMDLSFKGVIKKLKVRKSLL